MIFSIARPMKPFTDREGPMEKRELEYALNKQLENIDYIHTSYGNIELDPEMKTAVAETLRTIIEQRLAEQP